MLVRCVRMYAKFRTEYLRAMGIPNVVFVLGGPGAGKGTQCQKIVNHFGYTHLSAGDLLRAERKKPGSEVGALIEKHITDGSIVPVEITCGLLRQAMEDTMAKDSNRFNFLIDGFPRNKDNLDGWNTTMGDKSHLQFVLFFDCDTNTCIERCMGRGQAGSGRSDDNLESLKKRIETYEKSTKPIIDHYASTGLVKKVDASPGAEKVFDVVKVLFAQVKK